jgi:uncharacterized protein RhaS with RHS repeats
MPINIGDQLENNQLGTPRELTDQEGNITWEAQYTTWGNTVKVEYKSVHKTSADTTVYDKPKDKELHEALSLDDRYVEEIKK